MYDTDANYNWNKPKIHSFLYKITHTHYIYLKKVVGVKPASYCTYYIYISPNTIYYVGTTSVNPTLNQINNNNNNILYCITIKLSWLCLCIRAYWHPNKWAEDLSLTQTVSWPLFQFTVCLFCITRFDPKLVIKPF